MSELSGTAATVRDTKRLVLHPDWRMIGVIGYLWFDMVLFACFAAAGQTPPVAPVVLAYLDRLPVELHPGAGRDGVLDGSLIGMLVLYGVGGTLGQRGDPRLPRRFAVGPRRVGDDRVHRVAEDQEPADRAAEPD